VNQFTWTGQAPGTFESSAGVFRHFCNQCGSPLAFEADHYKGDIHLYAASLEDPSKFVPTFHVNYKSKLPWLIIHDDLKKYDGTVFESAQTLTDD